MDSNDFNMNNNDVKYSTNPTSLNIPKEYFLTTENNRDIFELRKKIISVSSSLLHNERRMRNLINAINKMTIKDSSISTSDNYKINFGKDKYYNYKKEEEKDKNISNSDNSNDMIIINNKRINKVINDDKKNVLKNNERELNGGKYPEPDDIDKNLVNVKYDNNFRKKNNTMIKIDKKIENKSDDSNENLYYINNRNVSNISNSNIYYINNRNASNISNISNSNLYYINNRKVSNINNNNYYNISDITSTTKDIQNNNSLLGNNVSNYLNNTKSNFNNNDITNIDNTSIEGQISYLENNIIKFENKFGK